MVKELSHANPILQHVKFLRSIKTIKKMFRFPSIQIKRD